MLSELPFIEEALHEDLINIASLARKFKPVLDEKFSADLAESAIAMTIRRIGPGLQLQLKTRFNKMLGQLGDIIVRSNLVDVTFQNSVGIIHCENAFIEQIKEFQGGFYSFSRGVYETTIIISADYETALLSAFSGEKKISHLTNLSSITLKMPASNTETLGLYYYFFKNLSEGGVNVIEVISTTNEATFVVRHEDVNHAFSILNALKN